MRSPLRLRVRAAASLRTRRSIIGEGVAGTNDADTVLWKRKKVERKRKEEGRSANERGVRQGCANRVEGAVPAGEGGISKSTSVCSLALSSETRVSNAQKVDKEK